jgi:hypothetical protein
MDFKKIKSPSICRIYKKSSKNIPTDIMNSKFFERFLDMELIKKFPGCKQIEIYQTFQNFEIIKFFHVRKEKNLETIIKKLE